MCWRTLAGSGPLNVSVWWPLVEQRGRQNQTLHSLEVKPSATKKSHMTDSGDMYQWGWIWTPPVAVREGVGTGCFQGGPLWLQQASVVPTTTPPNPICTPTPTLRTLFVPLPAGRWRGRLGHCCTQPANGSHAVALRDWSGSFLRGAHPSTPHPRGLTRDHNTYNDTHRPLSGWAG